MSLLLLLSQHSHFNLCHTQRCLRNSCSLKFHSGFTCHCSCTKLNTTTCHCSCTTLNTTCTTLVHCQCTVRSPAPLLALPLLLTLVTQLLLATSVFPSAALSDSTSCPTASTTVAAQPCSHTFSTQTAQRVPTKLLTLLPLPPLQASTATNYNTRSAQPAVTLLLHHTQR